MKSAILILVCLFHFSFAFSQITIAGSIKMSSSWNSTLYLYSVEEFSIKSRLLETIPVNSDGDFHHRINNVDPKRVLYKLLITPVGGDRYTTLEGYADNCVFLLLKDKDSCHVTAQADSFYYSSRLSGSANQSDPNAIQQYKRPFCDLTVIMTKEIKANPLKSEQIQKDFAPKWISVIDTLREELKRYIDKTESPGGKLLGLYNLYLAGFGELDSLYTTSVIANSNLKDYYLTNDLLNVIQSAENNRMGVVLPDVALFDSSGKARNLYSITKGVTIIDFWGSFCIPCRKANRNELRSLYSRLQNTDTTFFAISVDDQHKKWSAAMREDNIFWPSYTEQISHRLLNKTLGVNSVPVYLVINKDRTVVFSTVSINHLLRFLSGVSK
jgi:thiol-disulfide isomerase/thioredoxin